MTEEDFPDALPRGHRLHWYVLERVLGQGGFGITYLAHDTNLDRRVAIKEYLPAEVARRRSDASARPRTESHAERFAWGLERFLAEARTLARFDHPNIVRVLSIFEANSTAYMVMRFEEGEDLGTLLDRRGTLPERELMDVLLPVLGGLQLIHSSGFIHRDIKPENIYIRDDGSPVLLDFGSARQSFGSAKTMTILVAPGYAPLEQYYGEARTQGPWTDIYGLAATCYRAVTGRAPLDAIARAKGVLGSTRDLLERSAALAAGGYDASLLAAIDHALQLSERDRPQNIAEWRREIVAPVAAAPAAVAPVDVSPAAVATVDLRPTSVVAETGTVGHDAASRHGVASTAMPSSAVPPTSLGLRWIGATVLVAVAVIAFVGLRNRSSPPAVVVATAPPAPEPRLRVEGAPATAAGTTPTSASAPQAATTVGVAPAPVVVPAPVNREPSRDMTRDMTRDTTRDMSRDTTRDTPRAERGRVDEKASPERVVVATPPVTSRPRPEPTSAAPRGVPPVDAGTALAPSTAAPSTPPPAAAVASALPAVATAAAPTPPPSSARRRDEQLDAAEAALRRGDAAGAAQLASPWASAGVARAQTLLGRAQESSAKEQHSDFEAYVWYGIAARGGDASALTLRDRIAGRLQPAEIRQADQIVERWKPRGEAAGETGKERSAP